MITGTWQDGVNAAFEVTAIAAVIASCKRLVRDRSTKGIAPSHVAYSVSSAAWFAYYYFHLSQWYSLTAGVGYLVAVVSWAGLMLHFKYRGDR